MAGELTLSHQAKYPHIYTKAPTSKYPKKQPTQTPDTLSEVYRIQIPEIEHILRALP